MLTPEHRNNIMTLVWQVKNLRHGDVTCILPVNIWHSFYLYSDLSDSGTPLRFSQLHFYLGKPTLKFPSRTAMPSFSSTFSQHQVQFFAWSKTEFASYKPGVYFIDLSYLKPADWKQVVFGLVSQSHLKSMSRDACFGTWQALVGGHFSHCLCATYLHSVSLP